VSGIIRKVVWPFWPEVFAAWKANTKMTVPNHDTRRTNRLVDEAARRRATEFANLRPGANELIQLAVAQDRDRIAGLEGKGLAVSALPAAVAAIAALLVGHDVLVTVISLVAFAYVACSLFSASLVLRPRPRVSFEVESACGTEPLASLVAVNDVNRPLGLVLNNLVVAAVNDSIRGAVTVVIAAAVLAFGGA